MHETHGTSNTLAVKPYSDLGEGGHIESSLREEKKIDKELCERPFPGKYRETSSDIDKEPIMFVQFIQK
jgi:hypothetical protein